MSIQITFKLTVNKEGLKLETSGEDKHANELEKGLAGGLALCVKGYLNAFVEQMNNDAKQRESAAAVTGDILSAGKNGGEGSILPFPGGVVQPTHDRGTQPEAGKVEEQASEGSQE